MQETKQSLHCHIGEKNVAIQKEGGEWKLDIQLRDKEAKLYHVIEKLQKDETQKKTNQSQFDKDTPQDCTEELTNADKEQESANEQREAIVKVMEIKEEIENCKIVDEDWTHEIADAEHIEVADKGCIANAGQSWIADEEQLKPEECQKSMEIQQKNMLMKNNFEIQKDMLHVLIAAPISLPALEPSSEVFTESET